MTIANIEYNQTSVRIFGQKIHPRYNYADKSCLIIIRRLSDGTEIKSETTDLNGSFEFILDKTNLVPGFYRIEYYGSGVVEGKDWEVFQVFSDSQEDRGVLYSTNGYLFKYGEQGFNPEDTELIVILKNKNITNIKYTWRKNGIVLKPKTVIKGKFETNAKFFDTPKRIVKTKIEAKIRTISRFSDGDALPETIPDYEPIFLDRLFLSAEHNLFNEDDFCVYSVTIEGENNGVQISPITLEQSFLLLNDGTVVPGSYYALLTNENHTVVCDALGVPIEGEIGINGKAKTKIIASQGNLKLSYSADDTPSIMQYAIKSINVNGNGWEVEENTDTGEVYVKNISVDCDLSATIDIEILFNTGYTIIKTFSIDKSKTGIAVDLKASRYTIEYDGNENIIYASDIVFTTSIRGNYEGNIKYKWYRKYDNQSVFTQITSLDDNYLPDDIFDDTDSITLKQNSYNDFTELFERESIIKVEILDSQDNILDDDIVKINKTKFGESPYYVLLTNENHTVVVDNNNVPISGEIGSNGRAKTLVKAGSGISNFTYSTDDTPGTEEFAISNISVSGSGWNAVENTNTGEVYISQVGTSDVCLVTITVLFNDGTTINKIFSVNKNKGYAINLYSNMYVINYDKNGVIKNESNVNLQFSCVEVGNLTPASYRWKRKYDNGTETIISSDSNYSPSSPNDLNLILYSTAFDGATELFTRQLTMKVEALDSSNNILDYDEITVVKVIDGSDAKTLILISTSQAFTYDKNGQPLPTSQTITFDALLQNLSGSVSWSAIKYNSSGQSLGSITLGGSGNTGRTMTNTQFDVAHYAVVTISLNGLEDKMTIVRLTDGSDALVGFLTNESMVLPSDKDGNVTSYSGANGYFKVFKGLIDVSSSCTFSEVQEINCSGTINDTTGYYSVTSGIAYNVDTAKYIIQAQYGSSVLQKEFTLSKSKQGLNGTDSYTVLLTNETHTIACNSSGTPFSSEIGSGGKAKSDILVYKGNTQLTAVAEGATPSTGQFKYVIQSNQNCTSERIDNDTFYLNTIPNDSDLSGNIVVRIYLESNSLYVDKIFTWSKAKAGINGENGTAATYVRISFTSQVFSYDNSSDTTADPSTISLLVTCFGFTPTSYQWQRKLPADADVDGNWVNLTGGTSNVYTVNPTDSYWTGYKSFVFRCLVNGTYKDNVTISKVVGGNDGSPGTPGPGIVYRGDFDSTGNTYYFNNSIRRDVVKYQNVYYIYKGTDNQAKYSWNSNDWESFGATFSSVATKILLTENATIIKNLVMGDNTNWGVIRSYSADAFLSGDGYIIEGGQSGGGNQNKARGRFGTISGGALYTGWFWDGDKFIINKNGKTMFDSNNEFSDATNIGRVFYSSPIATTYSITNTSYADVLTNIGPVFILPGETAIIMFYTAWIDTGGATNITATGKVKFFLTPMKRLPTTNSQIGTWDTAEDYGDYYGKNESQTIGTGQSCFDIETSFITMADGTKKNIKDIKIGDNVKSFDILNNRFTVSEVLKITINEVDEIFVLDNIICTDTEPFLTEKGFFRLNQINDGQVLFGDNLKKYELKNRNKIIGKKLVMNLSVSEPNTFIVNDLIVHNKGTGYPYMHQGILYTTTRYGGYVLQNSQFYRANVQAYTTNGSYPMKVRNIVFATGRNFFTPSDYMVGQVDNV